MPCRTRSRDFFRATSLINAVGHSAIYPPAIPQPQRPTPQPPPTLPLISPPPPPPQRHQHATISSAAKVPNPDLFFVLRFSSLGLPPISRVNRAFPFSSRRVVRCAEVMIVVGAGSGLGLFYTVREARFAYLVGIYK